MDHSPRPIFRPRTSSDASPGLPEMARQGLQSLQRSLTYSSAQGSPRRTTTTSTSLAGGTTPSSETRYRSEKPLYVSMEDFPRQGRTSLNIPSFETDSHEDDDEIVESGNPCAAATTATPLYLPSTDGGALSAWSMLASRFSSRCEFEDC